jgi:glycosyltransferase involved in cell wall biosynthesis
MTGHSISARNCGDYVFSGGNSMRDYPTLIEAVRGLTIPVFIATYWQPPSTLTIPANVTIKPTSEIEFRDLLAGARFVIFPLRMDDLRTSGQQSYLNAMVLGKAVIVTDTMDAPFYIDHERTGMLTPSGDAAALRAAILRLLDSPGLVERMGEAGHNAAAQIDQEYTWSNVLGIAVDVHRRRRGRK